MARPRYKLFYTAKFKKDVRRILKRGYPSQKLEAVFALLIEGTPLPAHYKDHALTGSWDGFRECHIAPDWLLIYRVDSEAITLTAVRTGTHSDLFSM